MVNYYDDRNKLTLNGHSTTYYMTPRTIGGEKKFIYSAVDKKLYRYVGMDKQTADSCLDSKKKKYTRSIKRVVVENNSLVEKSFTLNNAGVVCTKSKDGYCVSIAVYQCREKLMTGGEALAVKDPKTIFPASQGDFDD